MQRIPEVGLSSRMQRIHTGTMTVIILPQPVEVSSALISSLPAYSSVSDSQAFFLSSVHSWTSTLIQRIFASTRSDLEALADKVSTQQTVQCASFIFPPVKHARTVLKLLQRKFCVHVTLTSAVFMVILTGISAECQQTRSQLQNRDTAMRVLRARLYQSMMGKESKQRHTARKQQVREPSILLLGDKVAQTTADVTFLPLNYTSLPV